MAIIAVNALYAGSSNSLDVGVVNGFATAEVSGRRDVGVLSGAVPEPASLLLLGAGLTVVGTMIRKRQPRPSNP